MPKPTDGDKDYFRSLFEGRPELELKPMFGHLAAFVVANQQMCAGLFGPNVGLRLGDDDRASLRSEDGAGPFGPPDRPMKEYVSMPLSWRSDPERCEPWIDKAIANTGRLEPKKKKKSKSKAKKRA